MPDLDLQFIGEIANIAGAVGLVTGLIFGIIQVRNLRRQQHNAIASSLAQTFYSHDLAQAIAKLQPLPDGITLREMRELGQEYELAAITLVTSFETMGLLVYRRIAPLDLVLDLAGGIVSVMCKKLRNWQDDLRKEQNQPSWGEWFEWLVDQATKRKTETEPAHIAYRDWKP